MSSNESHHESTALGELRADVRHIQSDVTDIKAELRITNQRIENIDQKFEKKIDVLGQRTDERFARLDEKLEKLTDLLSSAKTWALGLYMALAGPMLYVMARGFKWL